MCDLTFAQAVRRLRKARGMTQATLATAAHISRTQLVRIEREQGGDPGPGTHDRIVGALGFVYEAELQAAVRDFAQRRARS